MTNENRLDEALRHQLRHTLDATPWTSIGGRPLPRYDGKVRDCYIDKQRGERIIVVTDRLSAFDKVLGTMPDREVAARLGCRLTSVEQRRRKLRIRSVNPRGREAWIRSSKSATSRSSPSESARLHAWTHSDVRSVRASAWAYVDHASRDSGSSSVAACAAETSAPTSPQRW